LEQLGYLYFIGRAKMQATVTPTKEQTNASWEKTWGKLVAKVWADEDLKQRLMEDPATVLREHGLEVPYDLELKVVEDTSLVRHLVLPSSPASDLVDEDLTCSVGHDSFSGFCYCRGDCRRCGCGRCGCGCDAHS
jgi:hypothetical protein